MTRPPVPHDSRWAITPVDLFILTRLEELGARPSPPAERRALLRRVTFDLTGLPPTPEAIQAFVADPAPDAYARVVEKLLASPRYGERWARHWMDAVHFAETHGHDQDRIRTNAWPYRDYLISSFNRDKPYARFVREQLAGDVLYPDDPQATVALGFIAAGPWDESSLRDIREDTIDRQVARYIDRDDMVATTVSTLVSTTVHCARCHAHKFDPIPQEDYYSLQAVFAGVDRADRVYDPDPRVHAARQALLRRKRALENKDPALMESLLGPAVQAEIAGTVNELAKDSTVWTVLTPTAALSSNRTTLAVQPDGSILASGTRPEKDTYVITAETGLRGLTGVRLEVMTDESLPQRGPGRQDNGNLHLSEFKVLAAPKAAGAGTNLSPLALQRPSADFNQDGWAIDRAIDRREDTAWGIYPQVGRPHQAVFELATNAGFEGGTVLSFVLAQLHGGGHLIGRPRLSITTSPRPVRAKSLPDPNARILTLAPEARSTGERRELTLFALREQIDRQLTALGQPSLVYAAAHEFTPDGGLLPTKTPRVVRVLKRGDIHKPEAEARPGTLGAVRQLESRFTLANPEDEGSRRVALAQWVCDPRNPLTWRSIVNRVWQHHFGRGLVDTPNDFGRMGGTPSHPELLDWLAGWFQDHEGSFKDLHRLLVTSAVYCQSSADRAELSAFDADNRYLGRMNRSRLDAESVHDALLQMAGNLDLRMGGPSDRQFSLSPGVHVTPVVDYAKFDLESAAGRRRSVYRFLFRTLPDPFMDSLDCPEGSQLSPTRGESVSALQALALLHNPFVVHQSEVLAGRLDAAHPSLPARVRAAGEAVLGRAPSADEAAEWATYAGRHGLANLCRLLFNSNEFMFVN